jgi:transcriptional regulator with XRE-family HTH domain
MKPQSMTYPFEVKDRFVELRASGITMAEATKELGISHNTGLNWEKDLKERIETYRAIHIEELQEKYRISKEKRIELFGERFLAINEELKKRDLSEIPTPKLFDMMIRCMKALESEIDEPMFLSEAEIERKRDERILANNIESSEIGKHSKKAVQINR